MEEALQRLVSGSKQVTAELGYKVRRRQEPGREPGALVSGMGKTRKAGVYWVREGGKKKMMRLTPISSWGLLIIWIRRSARYKGGAISCMKITQ